MPDRCLVFKVARCLRFSLPMLYPPASEASCEVENFDWRKKHPPTRIWCQYFVCLSRNSTPIISGLSEQIGLKFFLQHLCQKVMSQIFFLLQVAGRAGAEGQKTFNQVEVKFVWQISYPPANGASLGRFFWPSAPALPATCRRKKN